MTEQLNRFLWRLRSQALSWTALFMPGIQAYSWIWSTFGHTNSFGQNCQ